jgi:hypothetical protein
LSGLAATHVADAKRLAPAQALPNGAFNGESRSPSLVAGVTFAMPHLQ